MKKLITIACTISLLTSCTTLPTPTKPHSENSTFQPTRLEIPEAKEFHPTLYTIQFSRVELPPELDLMKEFSSKKDLRSVRKHIQTLGTMCTDLATIHTSPNTEFSTNNEDIKGTLDLDSNTLHIRKMMSQELDRNKQTTLPINTKEWNPMFCTETDVNGESIKYCILTKLYAPEN
jgi:hypothetical protein